MLAHLPVLTAAPSESSGDGWGTALIVLLFIVLLVPVIRKLREQQGLLDQQRNERVLRQRELDGQQREREEHAGPPDIESVPDEHPGRPDEEGPGRGGP